MKKIRFRDIKKGIVKKSITKEAKDRFASIKDKLKAGITDSFMLLMPIVYIVFYLVMDGREDFAEHRLMGWIYIVIPFIIVQSLFLYFGNGQTPGYKSYDLRVVDINSNARPTILQILARNIIVFFCVLTILPLLVMVFRKDRRGLHDILTNTVAIKIEES
jgi:uncharacterized RDD family membrane protein YckC